MSVIIEEGDDDYDNSSVSAEYYYIIDVNDEKSSRYSCAEQKKMKNFVENLQHCHPIHHGFRIVRQKELIYMCTCSPTLSGWATSHKLLKDM